MTQSKQEIIDHTTEAAKKLADPLVNEAIRKAVDQAVDGREWTGDTLASADFDHALGQVLHDLVENAFTCLPKFGDRVRTLEVIERYPHFAVPAGSLGTVVDVDSMGTQKSLLVRMDLYLPGAEEWKNAVEWIDGQIDDVDSQLEVLPADSRELTQPQAAKLSEVLSWVKSDTCGPRVQWSGSGANLYVDAGHSAWTITPVGEVID